MTSMHLRHLPCLVPAVLLAMGGCSTSSDTIEGNPTNIGPYEPPPAGLPEPRVGIAPEFTDAAGAGVGEQASAQLETLVLNTDRFVLIDRTSLESLLREQGLEGIVRPDELARSGQVRGVDFLFIGTVTDFRLRRERDRSGVGVGRITRRIGLGGVESESTMIKTDIAVDLKMVDTTTGEIISAGTGEMRRTDSASSWGVNILGTGAEVGSEVNVDATSRGRLLRVALDDALRKMLPRIDRELYDWEPPERTAPAGGGGGETPVAGPAREPDDYLPAESYLARSDTERWNPTLMTEEPAGEKKEAEFTDLRTNKSYWSEGYVRTRPATAEDIATGEELYVINLWDSGHDYRASGQARKLWNDRFTYWEKTTVTGTEGLDRGVFQAPVGGSSRDVHISNARVAVE